VVTQLLIVVTRARDGAERLRRRFFPNKKKPHPVVGAIPDSPEPCIRFFRYTRIRFREYGMMFSTYPATPTESCCLKKYARHSSVPTRLCHQKTVGIRLSLCFSL